MNLRALAGPLVALASFGLVLALRGQRVTQARAADIAPAASAAPADARLRDGAPSIEALARRVVEGLSAGDARALAALTVRRDEYRALLFPGMTADQQAGADFYYDNMAAGSWKDLNRTLAELGGKPAEFLSVRATPAELERRGAVLIHRGIELRIRVDGQERALPLLGGVVEHEGVFKVTRYRRP